MDGIDWYYIYSQRYYPYDLYLKETIPQPFQANGIFIDQRIFDEHLYRHTGEHFFSRITVKVETIIKILKEKRNAQDTRPFFFTDVDIILRPSSFFSLIDYIQKTGFDMLFQQEYLEGFTVNPGIILIWPTENSVLFWEEILNRMKETITMEMVCINIFLKENTISWDRFDLNDVCSPITITNKNLNTFSIYHLLSGSNDRLDDLKEKLIQAKLLINDFEKYYTLALEKYGASFI